MHDPNIPSSIKSYSRANAAKIIASSERQLDRLIAAGDLKAYSIGSRGVRVTEQSIRDYIASRQLHVRR